MDNKDIAVIGGDHRNVNLSELLEKDGYKVRKFALESVDCATLEIALKGVKTVVGPIPFSNDGETINAPYSKEIININNFFKSLSVGTILIAGKLEEDILNIAKHYGVETYDILKREDFAILNAIPTAEGAIQIAMQETPFTLNSSKVMIIGFGRIGKNLGKTLQAMGADLTVVVKTAEEKAMAKVYGFAVVQNDEIEKHISQMKIIFNTAPAKVLEGELLVGLNPKCIIVDVSSKPGGVDFELARQLGIKTIWALSLPGKVAPETSAEIIRDTVYNILYFQKN